MVVLSALLVGVVYLPSLDAPPFFDDFDSLLENPTIRSLNPAVCLRPPNDSSMTGRPLVNATFAIQYAIHGLWVWPYHAVNFLLHLACGWILFGIVRRTLRFLESGHDGRDLLIAGGVSLLWLAHPLNSEAVIYITQRTELMAAFFLFLTLYAAIRAWEDAGSVGWTWTAIAACCLGMASKEIMVAAPLLIWLYDRTFVSGGFVAALRRSKLLYGGIFASWVLLVLVVLSGHRQSSTGFSHGITWWQYLATESRILLWYLRLSFWPEPLTIIYPNHIARSLAGVWPYLAAMSALFALTVVLIWKKSPAGFVGAVFFFILAPTSSVLPIMSEIAAERRMYIPLAGIAALVVAGGYRILERKQASCAKAASCGRSLLVGVSVFLVLLIAVLAVASERRARVYDTDLALWEDAVRKSPTSGTALQNLAATYGGLQRYDDALQYLHKALEMAPRDWRIFRSLTTTWIELGDLNKASITAQAAFELKPNDYETHWLLGEVAVNRKQYSQAIAHYRDALRINPKSAKVLNSLGAALFAQTLGGATPKFAASPAATQPNVQIEEAISYYQQALAIMPDMAGAHNNLGTALAVEGKLAEAREHFKRTLEINPSFADAHLGLGSLLAIEGDLGNAVGHFRQAVHYKPHLFAGYVLLGDAYLQLGRTAAAADAYRSALNEEPDNAIVHDKYGGALAVLNQFDEAIIHFEKALELDHTLQVTAQKLELARKLRDRRAAATQPTSHPAEKSAP
ncbi:MAG: tetratricopeptide repeat protein [Phycisphaeraceae bacterium]|nr:tetratricopeptide repeat protein [Phycisphaeraceae bacterium]